MHKKISWGATVIALKSGEGDMSGWRRKLSGWLRKQARVVEGRDGENWRERHYQILTMPELTPEEVDDCLERSAAHASSLMKVVAQSKAVDDATEDFFRRKKNHPKSNV